MQFKESDLLEQLKSAQPGQALKFEGVSTEDMDAAVHGLSTPQQPSTRTRDIDLGPHVSAKTYWWGVRVEFDHEAVQAVSDSASPVNLTLVGVPPPVMAIVIGVIRIAKSFDRGNGIIIFVTWAGVHWYTPR